MRRIAGAVAVFVLLVTACGGDDDDEAELELEPIAAVDPCELLDAGTAEDLAGDEVELVDDDDPDACDYEFTDDSVGSGVAASLRLAEGDESDVPGSGVARALDIGDAGAVEATDTDVKVVYVVQEIVVRIEIVPASGEVDDALVDEVVEFAETTEAPVVEAVTGEAPTTTEATTTTTEAATSSTATTVAATSTTAAETTIEELWRRTVTDHREQIGTRFAFQCPGPGVPGRIWGTGTYTDDSSVCTAAVHAGIIELEAGGDVTIEMTGPQDSWPGSVANGITSDDWPEWPAGFKFVDN